MGWAQVAGAAVGALRGYTTGAVAKAQIEGNDRMRAAFADASNKVRGGENVFAAARGALQRFMQSVNNNRQLDAGGHAMEATLVNERRHEDAVSESDFETQIRNTEQIGAQAAAAAFAGVGGSGAADMVSLATRLSQQRAHAQASRYADERSFDTSRRLGEIHQQMVGGLDTSLVFDQINYQIDVAEKHHALSPGYLALAGAVDSFAGSGGLKNQGQDAPNTFRLANDGSFDTAENAKFARQGNSFSFDAPETDYGFGAGGGGFGFD